MARPRPLLWDIMEEHLEEAAFLWTQWEGALTSPRFTRETSARGPEERLRAHLDALVLGGTAVEKKLLAAALAGKEADLAFASAATLLLAGREAPVLEALAAAGETTVGAIARAVALTGKATVDPALVRLATRGAPLAQAASLHALAARGSDPGDALRLAASSPNPEVQEAAIRSARGAALPGARAIVLQALDSAIARVRDAALEVGLVLGMRQAWEGVLGAASEAPPSPSALLLLALGGQGAELAPLLAAISRPAPPAPALFAAGFSGRRAAAEGCAQSLDSKNERTARLAAEAFSAITGLSLEGPFVRANPPEPEQPVAFDKEDLDADLVEGPEALLPLPKASRVEQWWKEHRSGLDANGRYLGGKPTSAALVLEALERGPLRRRQTHALEVAVRSQGKVRIPADGWLQGPSLSLDALRPIDFTRPFRDLVRGP